MECVTCKRCSNELFTAPLCKCNLCGYCIQNFSQSNKMLTVKKIRNDIYKKYTCTKCMYNKWYINDEYYSISKILL